MIRDAKDARDLNKGASFYQEFAHMPRDIRDSSSQIAFTTSERFVGLLLTPRGEHTPGYKNFLDELSNFVARLSERTGLYADLIVADDSKLVVEKVEEPTLRLLYKIVVETPSITIYGRKPDSDSDNVVGSEQTNESSPRPRRIRRTVRVVQPEGGSDE